MGGIYVIVDGPEDLLGRDQETRHLPRRHFEIHLGELEQSDSREPSALLFSLPLSLLNPPAQLCTTTA